jgi:hypothetical protein
MAPSAPAEKNVLPAGEKASQITSPQGPLRLADALTGLHIPEPDRHIPATRGQDFAIRRESQRPHLIPMPQAGGAQPDQGVRRQGIAVLVGGRELLVTPWFLGISGYLLAAT